MQTGAEDRPFFQIAFDIYGANIEGVVAGPGFPKTFNGDTAVHRLFLQGCQGREEDF